MQHPILSTLQNFGCQFWFCTRLLISCTYDMLEESSQYRRMVYSHISDTCILIQCEITVEIMANFPEVCHRTKHTPLVSYYLPSIPGISNMMNTWDSLMEINGIKEDSRVEDLKFVLNSSQNFNHHDHSNDFDFILVGRKTNLNHFTTIVAHPPVKRTCKLCI